MSKLQALWREYKGLLVFISLMMVFRSAVADWNYVPSSSMNPTLIAGDRVVVNKLAYSLRVPFTLVEIVRWDSPRPGDVVTFDSPQDDVNLIKRVVDARRVIPSEAGDVMAEVWRESLGDTPIDVARLPSMNRFTEFGPVQVPPRHMLVLGDSRDNSNDSRFIGFIDTHRVTGRAVRVALSHDPASMYLPRAERWWLPLHAGNRS